MDREPPGYTRIDWHWTAQDARAALRSRLGGDRSSVPPGLYALGRPGEDSPVLVTANYRLTFDILRRDLAGVDCWVLALDTRGVNVRCAAAGGTFTAEELVLRVTRARLAQVVRHRQLTLPQLCAAGMDAGLVEKHTGFQVRFGPVRSRDLPQYLATGRLSPSMGTVEFRLADRMLLVPSQLGKSLKLYLGFALVAILYAGLGPGGVALEKAWVESWPLFVLGLGSVAAGAVLVLLLLPVIPLRPFSLKGWIAGAAVNAALLYGAGIGRGMDAFLLAACWLFFPGAAAGLALSFADATPFITAEEIRGERRAAIPVLAALALLTAAAAALAKLRTWGMP